jgi:hypothetical protein
VRNHDKKGEIPIFTGYCFTEDGERMVSVELEDETEVFEYVGVQHQTYPRVVIIDQRSEIVVLEVHDSKIIFPDNLQGKEPWKDNPNN